MAGFGGSMLARMDNIEETAEKDLAIIPSGQVLLNIDARNPDAVTIANPYGGPLPQHLRDRALALRDQNQHSERHGT